jgi:outer membrane immunogenic protein
MAVKGAPPAPAPVFNWTGWYVGVNAGASFGRVKTDFNNAPFTDTGGGGSVTFAGPHNFDTADPSGFIGGGQIGYNWQWSPIIVLGFEADIQGAIERDSATLNNPFSGVGISAVGFIPALNSVTGTSITNYTTQIDWFGTVRARIGYVWGNGEVMSYLTGGLAYGEVKINGTNRLTGTENGILPFTINNAFGHSQVNTGWVAGYGTEGRLGATNWTWKVEGLYMDLGHLDTTGSGASFTSAGAICPATGCVLTAGPAHTHTHFTDGILRGGLNYKFF